jgi:adenine/guanine phosphoribosyltransferase-like PRPP-binding protein
MVVIKHCPCGVSLLEVTSRLTSAAVRIDPSEVNETLQTNITSYSRHEAFAPTQPVLVTDDLLGTGSAAFAGHAFVA